MSTRELIGGMLFTSLRAGFTLIYAHNIMVVLTDY